jgi:tetratricopeptide (TPR) repeat protein
MKKPMRFVAALFGLALLTSPVALAQSKSDSLLSVIKKGRGDTSQVNALNALSTIYVFRKPDSALTLSTQALELSKKMDEGRGWQKGIAASHHTLGSVHYLKGDFNAAIAEYTTAYTIREKLGDKKGMAKSILNIGTAQREQGDYAKAVDSYYKALKINEELNDKAGLELNTGNIGSIYHKQKEYTKALEYYEKALKLAKELGNKDHVSSWLGCIGLVYNSQKQSDKALGYYEQALKINQELGNKNLEALWWGNMGTAYLDKKEYAKALEHLFKALKMKEELGDKKSIALNSANIGYTYTKMKNYGPAGEYLRRCITLAKEAGDKDLLRDGYSYYAQRDSAAGNYKDAYHHYRLYIKYRDSVENEAVLKQTMRTIMQYEYDKKQAIAESEHKSAMDKQAAVAEEQSHRQKIIIGAVIIGLLLVIVFAAFMYNRFRVTQRQKHIIEQKEKETSEQKHIIEEKHKEITDSINYAERIQRSFLASKELLDKHLSEYFVFFQPKDVVSGDFYWAALLGNESFAYVTADSTGHGVPGAIMSLLNITSLERAIEHFNHPADILNDTRKTIIERLKKDGSADGGKDGMDCSLVVIDKNKQQLSYAAANNPVWIVRTGELLELAPDKMPVGKHDKDQVPFLEHTIPLQRGDVVYTFTDGMPDQFGGPKGKKFMYKPMKQLLISIAHLPMHEQKEKISGVINGWKEGYDQIDDICVIGIRI